MIYSVDSEKLKKFFMWNFIASLVIAALVAVVMVLIGHYTEIMGRVFMTLFLGVLHSLIGLMFVWDDSKNGTFNRFPFFMNTIFSLIMASFIASLFGIWKVVGGDTVVHFYLTFFLIACASLHVNVLAKASGKEKLLDTIIESNYAFIGLVLLMLQPIIYLHSPMMALGEFYYRCLAAVAIIDGTLTILAVIFYKLHVRKHPELYAVQEGQPSKRVQIGVVGWLLIIFFGVPFGFYLLIFVFGVLAGLLSNFL
jgi:hypothetical protein